MNQITTLIKKYPFSILFAFIYTCLWLLIFYITVKHNGSIAGGEAAMYGIIFASMIAVISVIISILLAIFKKDNKFYGYLSAYILLPVVLAFLLPMLS